MKAFMPLRGRLAMVDCKNANEGPWTRARGNEIGVKVAHLSKGERVRVDMEPKRQLYYNRTGSFPTDAISKSSRYRVCKEVDSGVEPSPTIVEVILHG